MSEKLKRKAGKKDGKIRFEPFSKVANGASFSKKSKKEVSNE